MAAPTGTALTGAGYSLSSGAYSKTFGSIVVSFVISDEPDTGNLTVSMNGDTSGSDAANAEASLAALGYPNIVLSNPGGLQSYGQSL